ncbi:hypothetical protein CSPX01_03090, partial [Colletotrichum filicis]
TTTPSTTKGYIITLSSPASHADVPAKIGRSRRWENYFCISNLPAMARLSPTSAELPRQILPVRDHPVRLTVLPQGPGPSIASPRISPHSSPMIYPRP